MGKRWKIYTIWRECDEEKVALTDSPQGCQELDTTEAT